MLFLLLPLINCLKLGFKPDLYATYKQDDDKVVDIPVGWWLSSDVSDTQLYGNSSELMYYYADFYIGPWSNK